MKRVYRESDLRDVVGAPYIAMLDLWTVSSHEKIGLPIEILVLDRREHPKFRDFDGLLNTALPDAINEEIKLIVYLETINPIDYQLMTHEIGHWILNLRGFKTIRVKEDSFIGSLINSLAHHRPLYELQRSLNIDPQNLIDHRASAYISLFSERNKSADNKSSITDALMLSDILLSCSSSIGLKLDETVESNCSLTKKYTDIIMETASYYNLHDQASNLKFIRMLQKNLKLKHSWNIVNDLYELRSLSKEVNERLQ